MSIGSGSIGIYAIAARPYVNNGKLESTLPKIIQDANGLISYDSITGILISNIPNITQGLIGATPPDNITGLAESTVPFIHQELVGDVQRILYGNIISSVPSIKLRAKGYTGIPPNNEFKNICLSSSIGNILSSDVPYIQLTAEIKTKLEAYNLCQLPLH